MDQSHPEVKLLREEDLIDYRITDVLIPLPGHAVVYPCNAKQWFTELLKEDGLDLNSFNHSVK